MGEVPIFAVIPRPMRLVLTERPRGLSGGPRMAQTIRPEGPADSPAIRRVLEAAFPTAAEARLVDLLRTGGHLWISLVAEEDRAVIGHIAFSPVRVDGEVSDEGGVGLAPLAVSPDFQQRGVGSQLVRAGLAACEGA